MSARNVLESQQSVHAATAGRRAAACWKLATGQALSLHPHSHGVLQIAQGQAWVTLRGALADLPGAAVDHVLQPGQQLTVAPGQHVVMEAWNPQGSAEAVSFRWDALPASALTRPASQAARDWDCGVVQPLRDLGQALGQGGSALGTALAGLAGAGGRFAVGLARFVLLRIAAPLKRRTV